MTINRRSKHRIAARSLPTALCCAWLVGVGLAQSTTVPCPPAWLPVYEGKPAANGSPTDVDSFDLGTGSLLVVSGAFTSIGGVSANRIASWNGQNWAKLAAGINHVAHCTVVYDFGTGPRLYVAGFFTQAGGVPGTNRIASWNGSTWSALAGGIDQNTSTTVVLDLAVHDEGSGPALFVTGGFGSVSGGVNCNGIAKWNGTQWQSLGTGLSGGFQVGHAMTTFDDGSGPALILAGDFLGVSGVGASFIAKRKNGQWSSLGSGANNVVRALAVFDDGSGPALYAGGQFTSIGGVPAARIARWDGSQWSPLGTGLNNTVEALAVHDDGSGPALYASGFFNTAGGIPADRIARWNGTQWSALSPGFDAPITELKSFDDGSTSALYVGGLFGQSPALESYLAKWGTPAGCGGVSYCTSKISSTGCVPKISVSGRASLSNPSSFLITSNQVEIAANGIQFFGTTGPSVLPFQDGVLCVGQPLHRLAIQNSGGALPCSGAMTYTLADVLAQPGGGALVVAGQQVHQQGWFRDPPALSTTGLTNGVTYVVGP